MNHLPRFLATALFVVLVALLAVLVVPQFLRRTDVTGRHASPETGPAPTTRAILFSQRAALPLALASVVLALAVLVMLGRPVTMPTSDSTPPLSAVRQEMGALAHLAANSAAQDAALSRERDVRRRAEEDAQLKQQMLAQSVDEKIRLGHDLHDGIIQSLYAFGLTLEVVRAQVQSQPAEAERRLEQMRRDLNNTIRDVRAYIGGLTPENLQRASFARAIQGQLTELGAGRNAHFDIAIDDDASALLTPEQNVETLQIAREAVSNALRHGAAAHITVRMQRNEGDVCLTIQDDGRGFEAGTRREGGFGLGNMRARAKRIGAELQIESKPGAGARIALTLPLVKTATA